MDAMELERWWGALAAVACGAGFRNMGAVIGASGVAGVSVVIGACLIMLMDAMSS